MVIFEKWNTVLSDDDLMIVDVRWGGGSFAYLSQERAVSYARGADKSFPDCHMYIKVLSTTTGKLYRVEFQNLEGYRMMDEGGFLEIWSEPTYDSQKLGSTVKILNSPWSEQSPLPSFNADNISYLIITDNECIEIITQYEPAIHCETPYFLSDAPHNTVMDIKKIDHVVLTVRNIDETVRFYTQVLGMESVVFGGGRMALKFGTQKINLHEAGKELEPKATHPTPGSADICFITDVPIDEAMDHISSHSIEIIEGPVNRTGANGPIVSFYFMDPSGNLIEVANMV